MSKELAVHTGGTLPDRIQFAKAMADASLLPKQYQNQPANVLVAMELGDALGIAPIVAINEVNVINGSPSLSASLMAALARAAGHKVRVTGDDKSATCVIVRGDDPDFEHKATWDEKKARAAGLWGKGHWAKDAGTMLQWRAISECVRFACSEVLGGVKYTPEELRESESPKWTQVPEQAPPAPTLDQAVAHYQAEPSAASAPSAPEGEPLRTDAQKRKIFALRGDLGMSNAELKPYMTEVLAREVKTTDTLTVSEAGRIIDALEAVIADAAAADVPAGVDPVTGEVVDDGVVDAEIVDAAVWPEGAPAGGTR